MTSLEWVRTFPEFTQLSDDIILAYIGQAELCICTALFCADPEYVIALAAAHSMSMVTSKTRSKGGAGAVTTIREGDLTLAFSAGNTSMYYTSDYHLTPYGARLKSMANNAGAGVAMNLV